MGRNTRSGRPPKNQKVGLRPTRTPAPPKFLTLEERKIWKFYAPLLAKRGFQSFSHEVLARYCTCVVLVRKAREGAMSNPDLIKEWRLLNAQARYLENDLMLGPAAALRAPAVQEDQPNKVDQILNG